MRKTLALQQQPALAPPTQPLPLVTRWTAWNEPNNPVFLKPQYSRSGGKWVIQSAIDYANICNAVYTGVHTALIAVGRTVPGEQVACGVTAPKGNDAPGTSRASVDPISFLTAAHKAGMKTFDAYAHHPYYAAPNESPTYVPTGKTKRRIQLGNINTLISAVTKLFKRRPNVLRRYQRQFRYILVDEFQDANIAQIELIELLGRTPDRPDNVMVVGDDDQSIYRFRGASFAAFVEFDRRFSGPPRHDSAAPAPGLPPRLRIEENFGRPEPGAPEA